MLGAGGVVGQVAVGVARLPAPAGWSRSAGGEAARRTRRRRRAPTPCRARHRRRRPAGRGAAPRPPTAVDLVLDPLFGVPAAAAAARVLAPGGRLVNLGGAAGDSARSPPPTLRSRTASVLGYTNNALTAGAAGGRR